MKAIIVFILSCVSAFAATTNGIRLASTTNTYTEMGGTVTTTIDVFTRDGHTNLVCGTRTKNGSLQDRWQRFYHQGSFVGVYTTYGNGSSTISSFGNTPYTLSFVFVATNTMQHASISSNFVILDAFICTNGIFHPANRSVIDEAQSTVKGMLPIAPK